VYSTTPLVLLSLRTCELGHLQRLDAFWAQIASILVCLRWAADRISAVFYPLSVCIGRAPSGPRKIRPLSMAAAELALPHPAAPASRQSFPALARSLPLPARHIQRARKRPFPRGGLLFPAHRVLYIGASSGARGTQQLQITPTLGLG
jgi:hypothetical protein